jgi:hypothetical protein
VIEGSILYDPIKASKIYLVLNVIVPKEFWVLDLINYYIEN